jgi:integrase
VRSYRLNGTLSSLPTAEFMTAKTLDMAASISGHVWLYQGKRRQTWCAKWRDHTGQHEKRLGRAWTGKGRPPQGFLRRREAEALLEEILVDARRGQLRQQRTGVTFADVAKDWYRRGPLERDWSASTQVDYRSVLDAHLLPEFGAKRIGAITTEQFELWRERLARDGRRSRKTVNKIATQAHAVFQHAVDHFDLAVNVASTVKRLRETSDPGASTSSRPMRSSCSSLPPRRAPTAIPAGLPLPGPSGRSVPKRTGRTA